MNDIDGIGEDARRKIAESMAAFIWHDMNTAPQGMDIVIARDDGSMEFVPADDNYYEWEPYDGKERGITKPKFWMRLERPK